MHAGGDHEPPPLPTYARTKGCPLNTRFSSRNFISGAVALALIALGSAPATPLSAQEQLREKEKGKERPREERREPPHPGPAAAEPIHPPAARPETPAKEPAPRPGPAIPLPSTRPTPVNPPPAARPGPVNQGPAVPGREPHPVIIVRTRDGGEIHRAPGGAIREVRTPGGAVIHYAPDGMRHVEVARPDGRVVFANGNGHGGYVQRPFRVHDQVFVQRTYVEHGVSYTRVYRPWAYRGVTYNVYMPTHYYRPAFYSWAYRPWGRPVAYRWGWGERPWYGYYRGYYTPYPYYASPVFWLTDFMVAATLESAYQARLDDASAPPPPPTYDAAGMTPEVKQAIADEVHRQVDQERAEQQALDQGIDPSAGAPPPLFSDNVSRIFLVASGTVAYDRGQERLLSPGDVLQLSGAPAPNATYADVVVLASRDRDVPRGSTVSVSLQDLQEMQNRMRANIDKGLGDIQKRQGQDGLPALPPQSLGGADAAYASGLEPDANAAGELSQVAQEASSSGQNVLSQSPQANPDQPSAGRSISLGMSPAEVRAILGPPKQTANIGAKRIEVYQDFKVTYRNGSVTDIQ